MKFLNQAIKLSVENFDVGHEKKIKRHADLLPDSIRAIFCGPSNCGKTKSLLALITHPNGIRFENVYVYSKSLNQPKYKFLKKLSDPIKGVKYLQFSNHESVISPDKALPNSIMVFDNIACEKQDSVRAYFCMCRHKNVDCLYLCQSYAKVPKHFIRDNVDLLAIFRQDDVNLKHIYDDDVNTDLSYNRFKELSAKCWGVDNYGFLVIDEDRALKDSRYRKGFDFFIINMCDN